MHFTGKVNFLSLFSRITKKILKPIYDLTRKGRQLIFKEIRKVLQELLVLHVPDSKDRFHLYSDISKFDRESAHYQIQNGKPELIGYSSKRMPEAARIYSITELESCGLAIKYRKLCSPIGKG